MAKLPKLADFEGRWQLTRIIEDKRAGTEGHLQGEVTFKPEKDGLLYEETGTLNYGSQSPMAASRRYHWRGQEDGIEVLFENGEPFHKITLDRSMPDAEHICDPDFYHVSYDFSKWPVWRSTWRVVGPTKDYRMVSNFVRVG